MTDERLSEWVKIFRDEFAFAAPEILDEKLRIRLEDFENEVASESVDNAMLESSTID